MYTSLDIVAGGMYGSESKGRVAADLVQARAAASPDRRVISIRVGGPNAGHVVVGTGDQHFAMRQIPVGFVDPNAILLIAAGSEVDLDVLFHEVDLLESAGYEIRDRLFVDPTATWLEPRHIEAERDSDIVARLGSTAKGIGAARADRIWRTAQLMGDRKPAAALRERGIRLYDPLAPNLDCPVVIEGTQGYGLGTHAGLYPQCTSGDCRAIDFAAQAGVMPWDAKQFQIHLVVRPYPIRVAGNSGPMQGETSWEELGLPAERTTVTQKIRRVGTFDPSLVADAVNANGSSHSLLHLAMADQVEAGLTGLGTGIRGAVEDPASSRAAHDQGMMVANGNAELTEIVDQLNRIAPLVTLGTGPDSALVAPGYIEQAFHG